MSGTHSSNLFEFCNGWYKIYYMRKHSESKPDLVSTVVADLPEEVLWKAATNLPRQPSHQQSLSMRK